MKLWQALGICPGEVVAFTGGGGKTSLALAVVRELAAEGRPALFTTTTKIWPVPWLETAYTDDPGWEERVQQALAAGRPACLGARLDAGTGKVLGVAPGVVPALKRLLPGCVILVEADGSGGRPLKVPAAHEPAIPPGTDLVVPMAGASALGQPAGPEVVHRAELLTAVTGLAPGSPVTPEVLTLALVGPEGCTRGMPPEARAVPVLGQADLPGAGPGLAATAKLLLETAPHVGRVVLAAPATPEPVRAALPDPAWFADINTRVDLTP